MYVGHMGAPTSWQDPWCQKLFQDYAAMAIAASQAVKSVSPEAVVIGPAASERSWYWDDNQTFLTEIFQRGVLEHFDAVSVHACECPKLFDVLSTISLPLPLPPPPPPPLPLPLPATLSLPLCCGLS